MLQRVPSAADQAQWSRPREDGQVFSLQDAVRVLLNYWIVILGCTIIGISLAIGYLTHAKPVFTAQVDVLIESNLPKVLQFASPETLASLDTPQVESQIAIVKSERVAERVVKSLGLADELPKAEEHEPSLLDRIRRMITPPPATPAKPLTPEQAAEMRRRSAIASVQGDMDVRRQGLSYSMQISYNANDPETAALRANAVAEAYIQDQIDTRTKAAEKGSTWLERRIEDLRLQMNAAALTVQKFKAKRDYRILPQGTMDALDKAAEEAGGPKPEHVTLEELESRAETYRKIFESYLAAYAESVQRQSYPVTNARIITPATPPSHKSKPRTLMILAAGSILGAFAGLGLALILNALDTRFRTPRQVRQELGIECLGVVAMHDTRRHMLRYFASVVPLFGRSSNRRPLGRRSAQFSGYHLSEVLDLPMSRFSRSIRNVRKLIDVASRTRPFTTLGVTSALPGEGKSTFVANLATLYTMLGSKVLLVDADIVKATLSHVMAPDRKSGLLEAMDGTTTLDECIIQLGANQPALLPMSPMHKGMGAAELVTSKRLSKLIEQLKSRYDVILFDLPPMRPVGDAVAVAAGLDSVVVAIRWAETPSPLIVDIVDDLRRSGTHTLGAVLTMALDHSADFTAQGY